MSDCDRRRTWRRNSGRRGRGVAWKRGSELTNKLRPRTLILGQGSTVLSTRASLYKRIIITESDNFAYLAMKLSDPIHKQATQLMIFLTSSYIFLATFTPNVHIYGHIPELIRLSTVLSTTRHSLSSQQWARSGQIEMTNYYNNS